MVTQRKIDWYYLQVMCEKLAKKVEHANFKSVYGVPRGGLIPATIISHYLDIPLVTHYPVNAGVYEVLIVDDIADSGRTLKELEHQRQRATLFVNEKRCNYYPDFFVEETEDWIVFPYEYEEDTVSNVQPRNYNGRLYGTATA